MRGSMIVAAITVLGVLPTVPATAVPLSVCWNDGSGAITTCAHGGPWNPNPSASGAGLCYRAIVLYDTGSGEQSTGWRWAGAAVELGGEFVYVCT